MILRVLTVGDVCAEVGLDCLHKHLRSLKKLYDVHFTVVNGENAAGTGLLPRDADEIFDAGADGPPSSPQGSPEGALGSTRAPGGFKSA